MTHRTPREPLPAGRWLLAAALVSLLPASAAGQELTEFLDGVRTLSPAEGWFVEGVEASIGHLTLRLDQGALFPLRAGDSTLGIFFEGEGSYAYTSEDPADLQVMQANIRTRSREGLYHDGAVRDDLDRLLVFFAGPILEDLWVSGETSREVSPEVRGSFGKAWKRLLATDLEFDHLAAQVRFNGDGAAYAFAEIEGKKDTLGFYYDDVRGFAEGLVSFRKLGGVDRRLMSTLSQQFIGGGPPARTAELALTEANIDVATEDNRSGTVTSDLTMIAGRDGVRVAPLLLLNNRNPYSWDWGSERNQLRIRRVSDAGGNELPFSHRYHEVLVQLPAAAAQGDTVRLRFETEGEFLTSAWGERDDNYFELFTDWWYPMPMAWSKGLFEVSLKVRTRKPFRPVATGAQVSFQEEGKSYVLETRGRTEPGQVAVFAGKYKVKEQEVKGRTIRVHAYAMASEKALSTLLGLSDYFLAYFEHALGPYPFDDLDVVEVPEWGFGIAPAGMVLLTSEAYNPQDDFLSRYFSRGINSRLAHEIAHQWFGHKATPETPRDNWLSESFAEYMSGLAMAVAGGDERQVAGFRQMHADWWLEAKYCKDAGPITAANMISGDMAGRHRYGLLYNRGPLVLHMLRTYIGDDAFLAVLRRFLEDADMGPASTEDFEAAAREVLGEDISWFVDQWVREGGVPEVKVEYDFRTDEEGKEVLFGSASVVGGDPKKIYIPIVLEYASGQTQAVFLDMDEPSKEFHFNVPEHPRRVSVDPAHNNLVIYR